MVKGFIAMQNKNVQNKENKNNKKSSKKSSDKYVVVKVYKGQVPAAQVLFRVLKLAAEKMDMDEGNAIKKDK